MDLPTAASIFRTLGTEAHLALHRRLAEAAPGLPLSALGGGVEAALGELEAVGLVRRNDGVGAPWYEADGAVLVRALRIAMT